MTFLKWEFCGLHKNGQKFYPMCLGGWEIAKHKVSKVLVDTLYYQIKTGLGQNQPNHYNSDILF